jgi:hypothetical protein
MPSSLRAISRAAGAIMTAALAGAGALAVASSLRGPITVDMTAELSRSVMTGFYPPERVGDLTFAWTSGRADLVLAGLARERDWSCVARLRAARRTPPAPHLDVLVDGLQVLSRDAPNDFDDVRFELPRRTTRADTRIGFAVNPTVVPGPQDRRPLGVQVDRISCAPREGEAVPASRGARATAVFVPAVFAAAGALSGVSLMASIATGTAVGVIQTIPLDAGIAAYTPFVRTMTKLGIWLAILALVLVKVVGASRRRALSPFAAGGSIAAAGALYLQLAGLLHPATPPIDVVFQAHRFDAVLAGNYFFTQPMPGGVAFPYAIALYLFAAPWARLTSDHASLLRIVVCASDAVGYLLLFWLVMRAWRDRYAAASALVLAFAFPLAFEVIGNANLTNEFGHAASTAALALAASLPGARRWLPHAILLTAICTLALLAHVSTFALLSFTLIALSALYWWVAAADLRRAARLLLIATMVSAGLAIVGYYAHFMDVYRDALRVRTGAVSAASAPMTTPSEIRGRTADSLPLRVVGSARQSIEWIGWPMLLLAAGGAFTLVREKRNDPATLTILACAAAYVVFDGLAVIRVQPEYQRYTVEFVSRIVLATSPGVVLLAGAGASSGFRSGLAGRIAASGLIIAAVALAGRQWIAWFT